MVAIEILIAVLAIALVVVLYLLCRLSREMKSTRKNNRMVKAFLNNVNTEIRSPLKVMNEMAAILRKDDLYLSKNEKRDMSDQLLYNANLIGTLLDEVMMFSDPDSEGHQLKDDVFSPNALCRRCLEANMYSIYHRQAVRLTFKRELSDEYFVKSDRHMVELILNKLILNACRFTEEGEILMGCNTSEHPGHLTVFVKDTGVGIPETRINSLFSWFDAPDDMADEAELDLSICQRLAEKLGGMLQVDSTPQKEGTRMLLLLPVK